MFVRSSLCERLNNKFAENVHIVLSSPYYKVFIFNLVCLFVFNAEQAWAKNMKYFLNDKNCISTCSKTQEQLTIQAINYTSSQVK